MKNFDVLDYLILVLGAYYIIALGIFKFGFSSPRAQRFVRLVGEFPARLLYMAFGVLAIVLVVFEVI
ncbi:hypothetical protein RI065_01235 [Mycoplasmatota bacterium zrk1]